MKIFLGVCLCITEPYAGSDVSNIKTTAKKTSDGEFYILNGMKKWITNGTFADFFIVAARTGGEGMKGISVFLLEKSMPGLKVRQMNCTGMWSSGTSYVTFDNMKIPKKNLIGKENEGKIKNQNLLKFQKDLNILCIISIMKDGVFYHNALDSVEFVMKKHLHMPIKE